VLFVAIWVMSIILILALSLLITEKLPLDLTAIGIMVILMVTGILTPLEAVAGFANPAVITVGAMFLISRAMVRTGVVGYIAQKVISGSRGNANIAMLVTLLVVAVSSAFINNTPVVVLFIPVVLSLSCEYGFSPSKFLIPISYASILAGTCTLIGTSTNIIISDLSADYGFGTLGMFELSAAGVPIAIAGVIFIFLFSPWIMPSLSSPTCELGDGEHRRYLAEFKIPRGSRLIGGDPAQILTQKYPSIEVLELIRYSHVFYPQRDPEKIAADDLLLVKGSLSELIDILQDNTVELPDGGPDFDFRKESEKSLIVELIIPPQSTLLNERLLETELKRNPDIHIIAIKRTGLHYTEKEIHDIRLRIGDILLVRSPLKKLDEIRAGSDFIIVEDVHHEIIHKKKAPLVLLVFGGIVAAASFGLADIMVCALAGVFLMIFFGCLQLRDAYRALPGNILLLIVGVIALGAALEKTGATQLYAETFLSLFSGLSPRAVLGGIILLTSLVTHLLSNNATGVLLLPIAVSTALTLGVDPKPFIIGVCFGASACFASPMGYQTNLLVYGPGSYRFADYLKLGIPLNLIVIGMGLILIPIFWPF
jgi:di/tricarboxylate transporter